MINSIPRLVEHLGWSASNSAQARAIRCERRGLPLLRFMFNPHYRDRGWRTMDLSRRVNVHWVEVRKALRMGQMAGLVELRGGAEGEWWWRG